MKSEAQAQADYKEIEDILNTLSQRVNILQYDKCDVEIYGGKIKAKLIERPGYRTISHVFTTTGKYMRTFE